MNILKKIFVISVFLSSVVSCLIDLRTFYYYYYIEGNKVANKLANVVDNNSLLIEYIPNPPEYVVDLMI